MDDEATPQKIVVTDIRMPFFSMVVFMVKWAIAAIPAVFILVAIGTLFWSLVLSFVLAVGPSKGRGMVQGTEAPRVSFLRP